MGRPRAEEEASEGFDFEVVEDDGASLEEDRNDDVGLGAAEDGRGMSFVECRDDEPLAEVGLDLFCPEDGRRRESSWCC